MKFNKGSILSAATAVVLCITLAACTVTSTLVVLLAAVNDAASVAEAVVESLQASGVITVGDATTVMNDAQAVSGAVTESITELDSTDTNAVKATKIAGYFAAVTITTAGLPPRAAALIGAIETGIQVFLSVLQSSSTATAVKLAPGPLVLTHGDKEGLKAIGKKAAETGVKAVNWKAAHPK